MKDVSRQVEQQLEDFRKNKSLDALRRASSIADSINPEAAGGDKQRIELWRSKLNALLVILAGMDEEIDPAFNAKDVPLSSVAPPVVNGVVLDSGIDPKYIKDQQVRRAYEQAIDRNAAKARQYAFQTGLRKIDAELMSEVERIMTGSYVATVAARREVSEALENSIKNPSRKARLRELLSKNR